MNAHDDIFVQISAVAAMRTSEDRHDGSSKEGTPIEPPQASSTPVSLMITQKQRSELRALGFSDEAVAEMKPAEAHGHLGL